MTIEQAAREYIRLRRLKLDLKEHRNGLHDVCGFELGDDHIACGTGRDCCVFTVTKKDNEGNDVPDKDGWCDDCLESDVTHEWFKLASTHAAVALRRLEREVNR